MLPEIDRPSRRYHALGQILMWSALPIFALELAEVVIRLTPPPAEGAMALAGLVGLLGMVQTVVYAIIAIMWLIFLFVANANLHLDGVKGLKFSPAGAVGWWFVPFAYLWMGYAITREIWLASAETRNWEQGRVPLFFKVWWLCWIVPNLVASFDMWVYLRSIGAPESSAAPDATATPLLATSPLDVTMSIVGLVGIVLFALVVRGITVRQLRLADIAADRPALAAGPA